MEEEQQEEKKIIRRAPAIPTSISNLSQTRSRVCIAGTIVSKNAEIGSFILDDGNARVMVLANIVKEIDSIKEGQFVRVFGKVVGEGDEAEVLADIVQDISKIDRELYQKVYA